MGAQCGQGHAMVPLHRAPDCSWSVAFRWFTLSFLDAMPDLAPLAAQSVKNLPAMQETQCLSLEDPLKKEMATLSSILAWRIPWTEEPGGLQSTGSQESDRT